MPRTRSSTRSVAEDVLFNADTLEGVASLLDCRDLAHLKIASKKLSSAVDDAASRLISAMHARYGGDEELSPLEELRALVPLTFDCLLGQRIGYVEGDEAVVYSSNPNTLHTPHYICMKNFTAEGDWDGWEAEDATALCSQFVMIGGKHFAEFDITEKDADFGFRFFYARIGIMRPIGPEWRNGEFGNFTPLMSAWFNDLLGEKTDAWGSSNKNAVLHYSFEGYCEWGDWTMNPSGVHKVDWDGMEGSYDDDDYKIGLLLDLDEGTLAVYKDGRRLGVMMDGLTGEYCWVVNLQAQAHGRPEQQNVRIRRAPIPGDA
ncbi:hypothetical protein ACHAXT_009504 [Thalassiosira profunda]